MASKRCPECGSTDVTKVGHYASNNTDEYVCNDCGEEFTVKCDQHGSKKCIALKIAM